MCWLGHLDRVRSFARFGRLWSRAFHTCLGWEVPEPLPKLKHTGTLGDSRSGHWTSRRPLALWSRTRMSSTQAIVSCAPYASPVVPMTPRWCSCRFPPFLAAPCSHLNGFRHGVCYGASGVVISQYLLNLALLLVAHPSIHGQQLPYWLAWDQGSVGMTGLAQFAPPMEMHFVVAELIMSRLLEGTRSSATAPPWLHH